MVTKPIAVLIGLLFAALCLAEAQASPRLVRVGFLSPSSPAADQMRPGLLDGLRQHGYAEGQNLVVETRYAEGRFERLPELAAELVRLRCDVIVAAVTQASLAARDATATIPIVMIGVADPVAAGLVASLARPGSNVTGTSGATTQVVGKQLELLKETFPDVVRVAVLWNPANPVYQALQLREAEIAARALRIELQLFEARKPGDLERSLASIATRRPLLLMGDPLFNAHRHRITELATARRVPIVTSRREYAEAGALLTYGSNFTDLARRSAVYVDRILKGAKPADLPVEEPTRFELVINRKTAKALGLTIPPSLRLRTDQIID
ncbi:MAG: ABC transporter substrate-binding protein [Candidatus Rokuibacteriota bacterium]